MTKNGTQSPSPLLGNRTLEYIGNGLLLAGFLLIYYDVKFNSDHFMDVIAVIFGALVGFLFLWTIVLGGFFFIIMHHLTHAVWSTPIRRIQEMLVSLLPLLGILFLLLVLPMLSPLYEWVDQSDNFIDPIIEGKKAYLNIPFFIARAFVYFAIWIGFGFYFLRGSLRQDKTPGDITTTHALRRAAPPAAILFALTITFASFDWIMSLEPHWFSTIFGVYIFAGMAVSALSVTILFALWFRKRGLYGPIVPDGGTDLLREPQLYHLGTLLFAFSCFWGYIAMSQLLLIWYANLPEETFWFADRWQGGWKWISITLIFLRFTIPFFALLSRSAKTSPKILGTIAAICLLGQFVDIYWLVIPEYYLQSPEIDGQITRIGDSPDLVWQVLGPTLAIMGLALIFCGRFIARHPMVPAGDPLLEESRRYEI